MEKTSQGKAVPELPHPHRTFALAMLAYLIIVHGVGLVLPAAPGDAAVLGGADTISGWAGALFRWEVALFGESAAAYRAVNLLLLYGLMFAVFVYTRHTVRGPWWMGSLAATMTMANPALREAVLGVDGVRYLLPAALLMAALAAYAVQVQTPKRWGCPSALLLGALAMFSAPLNLCAPLLFLLHEVLIAKKEERNIRRPMPFFALGIVAVLQAGFAFSAMGDVPVRLLPPLHFVLYPIGLMPETAAWFAAHPAAAWASIAVEIGLVLLVVRAARHCALTLGVAAAFVTGWTWCAAPVNPVTLAGGGQLLLPAVFCMIAFAGFCDAVWRHPKWRKPVVLVTALLCVLLFVLSWRAAWESARPQPDGVGETKVNTVVPLV